MFSSCKFTVSLGISLPVLQWLLSTFQSCSELPVPGALGFPRTLFSSVVNTAGGLAGSQRDLEISVMCDQGLNPSSMWSQPVQGRQGVLNSSWSSSVQRWSSVRTNRDHSAPREHRTWFAYFLDFLQIPTVQFWESETSLPVLISCLHTFQPQALSAFRVPPQRDGADPGSHAAPQLPAHRTEPLLHCQPRVKPPRITQVRLGFLTPLSWVWLVFVSWKMSLLSCWCLFIFSALKRCFNDNK